MDQMMDVSKPQAGNILRMCARIMSEQKSPESEIYKLAFRVFIKYYPYYYR